MAYTINQGSIVQFTIKGLLDNQTTRNVFRYRYQFGAAPIGDGGAELDNLTPVFANEVYVPLINSVSTAWTLQSIIAQWIIPTRFRPREYGAGFLGVGAGGTIAGGYQATTVSAVVSVSCERAGRAFQGRRFFCGVPNSSVTNSQLNGGGLTEFGLVKDGMLAVLTSGGGGLYIPTLSKAALIAPPDEQKLFIGIVHPPLRVQRRREVGRGE